MSTRVILNPDAGSAAEAEHLKTAIKRLGDVSLRTTESPGHAQRIAREAAEEGHELIVAAGGDGTINEVVNGLAEHVDRVRFGIIPLGTGNDFVRSINVPNDVEQAVAILAQQRVRAIDIVRVESDHRRHFINVSAGGFSGLVDEKMTSEMKRTWGPLAYLRSALEALPDLTDYRTMIAFDDEGEQQIRAYNVVVANARFVAGGIEIAPQAKLDDGLVDVLIIPVMPIPRLALLAPRILLGQHINSDLVQTRRARKVFVNSTPGMWFNADGELVGNEPATFEVLPHVLQTIVGPEQE